MKNRRFLLSFFWVLLGAVLVGCRAAGLVEEYWGSMGVAFVVIGGLQIFRSVRYLRSAEYRDKVDMATKDERNRFLANKAWAWAGYLYVMIAAVASIALKLLGHDLLCQAAAFSVCGIMVLYWVSYLVLQKKY